MSIKKTLYICIFDSDVSIATYCGVVYSCVFIINRNLSKNFGRFLVANKNIYFALSKSHHSASSYLFQRPMQENSYENIPAVLYRGIK